MLKKFIAHRLAETSTLRGVIMLLAGAFGLEASPELVNSVISVGVAISGLVGILLPDKFGK